MKKTVLRIASLLVALQLLAGSAAMAQPAGKPAAIPVAVSVAMPTARTTANPTTKPAATAEVTAKPTTKPAATATAEATAKPTTKPTATAEATAKPTTKPAATASAEATAKPTATAQPTQPAATETVTPEPTQDSMPLGVKDLQVQEAIERQNAELGARFETVGAGDGKYADYYFGSTQTLNGITSSISLYIDIPDYADVTDAILRVSYACSDLILADLSSMTFYMNGTPFDSVGLVVRGDEGQNVIYVTVPLELIKDGYNLLEISTYVRLTDDEGCQDDFNGANWVRIADTTCLRIYYDIAENAGELAVYPYPFISLDDDTGADCAIAVSDAADDDEMAAALAITAGLGSAVSAENDIEFARISETQRGNVIYVGLAQNTPDEILALLDQPVPASGALIRRAGAGGREYLLVISNEPAALMEAARLIADDSRMGQIHASYTSVAVGEAQLFIEASQQSSLALEGQYTLTDILGHGASFTGPFSQQSTLYLPVPEDYALSSGSRFSLNIRYSENLDFDRSLMTVYWGSDVPLCSRKLTREGAAGETVSFSVPADAIGQSGTSIKIVFDLEIKDLDCTVRSMNTPWAFVAEDSTFYLPQGESASLSLSNRPSPFQRSSRLNAVLVVLPDDVKADELNLAGRAMAMLGAGSDPYGELTVIRAGEFSQADYGSYNIVAIGRAAGNSFISGINDSLYFQYNDAMTAFVSNSRLIMNDDYAAQAGTVQLISSPYDADRAVLVLTAPDEKGIASLTAQISSDEKRWALEKEAVIVDSFGSTASYQFTASAQADGAAEKPDFVQVVTENREPMLMLLVGMGSMLLLLLGAIIVLVRIRHRHKNDE